MMQRICRNCEYWDGGGEVAARSAAIGDCLNRMAPRFQTEPSFTCPQFYLDSSRRSLMQMTIPPPIFTSSIR